MEKCLNKKNKGFTLVEVIVVLVILAILAAIIIPTYISYTDKVNGLKSVAIARQAYTSSTMGLRKWIADGSPGRSDASFKQNIEFEIIKFLNMGEMKSYVFSNSYVNTVQVGLSLPNSFRQGWEKFISDCKVNHYRNFILVWVGKKPGGAIGDTIKAIYYIAEDGRTVSRVVYDETTKLGSPTQLTGSFYETLR